MPKYKFGRYGPHNSDLSVSPTGSDTTAVAAANSSRKGRMVGGIQQARMIDDVVAHGSITPATTRLPEKITMQSGYMQCHGTW